MNTQEYDEKLVKMAKQNHIWLNGMNCIRPTDEFKIGLADTILKWLNDKGRLMPASYSTSDDKNMQELAELTPMLYLSINKS